MKGDNKTNKAIEFLYNLSLNDNFIKDINEAKKFLKIPEKGFKGFTDDDRLKLINNKKTAMDLMGAILHLAKKYSIPLAYHSVFQEYIETGKLETKRRQDEFVAFIDPTAHRTDFNPGHVEDYYNATGEPFAKLIILGNNSKTDVMNFIDKNWEKIEEVFLEQGHDVNKRVRNKIYKNRDAQIIILSKKSPQELRQELKSSNVEIIGINYKEDLIRKLLKLDKYGGSSVSSGYIRKILGKYKSKKL